MYELWVKLTLQVYEFSIYYQFFLSRELVIILLPGIGSANILVLYSQRLSCSYVCDKKFTDSLSLCLVVSIYSRYSPSCYICHPSFCVHYFPPSCTMLSCVCMASFSWEVNWFCILQHAADRVMDDYQLQAQLTLVEADQNPQHYQSTWPTSYLS